MQERGELRTYDGVVTPVDGFLRDLAADLEGVTVKKLAADGYKDKECKLFLDRLVLNGRLRLRESLALATAVSHSSIHRDANGNPGLEKSKARGRIDLLSAMVISARLAEEQFDKRQRKGVYRGLA